MVCANSNVNMLPCIVPFMLPPPPSEDEYVPTTLPSLSAKRLNWTTAEPFASAMVAFQVPSMVVGGGNADAATWDSAVLAFGFRTGASGTGFLGGLDVVLAGAGEAGTGVAARV